MKTILLLILHTAVTTAAAASSFSSPRSSLHLTTIDALKERCNHDTSCSNNCILLPRCGGSAEEEDTNDDSIDADESEEDSESISSSSSSGGIHQSSKDAVESVDDSNNSNSGDTRIKRGVVSAFFSKRILPYYQFILLRMKRGLVAGWDAAWKDDSFCSINKSDNSQEDEEDWNRVPNIMHSFLGKTGYVFMEVYRGVTVEDPVTMTTAAATGCIDSLGEEHVEKKMKRKRRHKKKKKKHHHNRHLHKKLTTKPTAIANGGDINPGDTQQQQLQGVGGDDIITSLAKKYNIEIHPKHHSSILHSSRTSFNEALQKSNADARFLICYINPPSSSKQDNDDDPLLPILLNPQFTKLLPRKPLGKKNIDPTSGSYYLWIGNTKSDKETICRRLKNLNTKNNNNSNLLCILHPASTIDSTGKLRTSPKLIVQHHCNPPPSSVESISSWVTSVRKRHYRDFAKLQHDKKERILYKERSEGYTRSIVDDTQRQLRLEAEMEKLQKKKEEEEAHLKAIEERRIHLLQELQEEPENGDDVITIALRFQSPTSKSTDTASLTRRFMKNDTLNHVLNWVDAVHGLEREKVCLSTMNGGKSFVWEDNDAGEKGMTLEEAGLGKLTALRVGERVSEEQMDDGDGSVEEIRDDDE